MSQGESQEDNSEEECSKRVEYYCIQSATKKKGSLIESLSCINRVLKP